MDLLRKIDTRIVTQPEVAKREVYQTIDALLQVDRRREGGEVVAFELRWDDAKGRRFSLQWSAGHDLVCNEVDIGEDGFATPKQAPLGRAATLKPAVLTASARAILEERGKKLPTAVYEAILNHLTPPGTRRFRPSR